jgi:hypothetical protein
VTGTMADLELLLPGDGVLERGDGGGAVEPALVQTLNGGSSSGWPSPTTTGPG